MLKRSAFIVVGAIAALSTVSLADSYTINLGGSRQVTFNVGQPVEHAPYALTGKTENRVSTQLIRLGTQSFTVRSVAK
jgi:hypothetical protein